MKYQEALRHWGAIKLREIYKDAEISPEYVSVSMQFNKGYACCGGRDPNCYCSFAESPSANVTIYGDGYSRTIDIEDFDFATVLGEIVDAAHGAVTT